MMVVVLMLDYEWHTKAWCTRLWCY